MEFLRKLLEGKLGGALGMPVTMGGFSASPFSGRVEINDLALGSLLHVRQIVAKISVAKALKRTIAIQSLTIQSPSITIDGPLPRPPARPKPKTDLSVSATAPDRGWSVEAEHILISGGRLVIRVPKAGDYSIGLEALNGEVRNSNGSYEFAGTAPTVGRRDESVELGAATLSGRMAGRAIEAQLKIGTAIDARMQSAAVQTGPWNGSLEITLAAAMLLRLLPKTVELPIGGATGEATMSAAATVDSNRRVMVERFSLSTRDVVVETVQR